MEEKNINTPDWAKIRAEYVNSDISQKELALKYKVSRSALQKRSAQGKWNEERKQKKKKKADAVAEKLHDNDIKQTVKDIDRCVKSAGKLIDKINKAINEVDKAIYISTEDKEIYITESKSDDGKTDITKTKHKRKFRTTKYDTLVDTKKLAEISKSLLNIKQILTDTDNSSDDEGGELIEIQAINEIKPPDEEGAANE